MTARPDCASHRKHPVPDRTGYTIRLRRGLTHFTLVHFPHSDSNEIRRFRLDRAHRVPSEETRCLYISRSMGKFRSQSTRSSTTRRFRCEIPCRCSGLSLADSKNRLANSSTEAEGASHPFSASTTHSRFEGISVTTTGNPVAIASNKETEVPSDFA